MERLVFVDCFRTDDVDLTDADPSTLRIFVLGMESSLNFRFVPTPGPGAGDDFRVASESLLRRMDLVLGIVFNSLSVERFFTFATPFSIKLVTEES